MRDYEYRVLERNIKEPTLSQEMPHVLLNILTVHNVFLYAIYRLLLSTIIINSL